MLDLHNHSEFSMDSNTPMEKNIKYAIQKNIKYLSITDHMEIVKRTDKYFDTLDAEGYFKEYNRLKEKYKGEINLLSGVEVGIQECTSSIVDNFVNSFDYDFVIGSVHSMFEKDLYSGGFYKNMSITKLYKTYYEEMYKSVKANKNFDVLGHIDYIDRYLNEGVKPVKQEINEDLIKMTLKELIETDRGIEINTGGMRKKLTYFHPHEKILKWYKELGGQIITIGSDAHKPYDIGYKVKDSIDYLKSLGFDSVYIFEKRKPRKLEI